MTGTPGHPVKAAAPYVDFSTAVLSAFGTLAALIHRMRTGEGQHVQTTLQGTALSVFASHLIEQSVTQRNRVGTGNRVQTSAPSDVFATRDGHVLIHVVGNGLFRRWARLMGDERRWLDEPRYQSDASRGEHSEAIIARMRDWCALRTSAEATRELEAAGLPASAVNTLQQALDDPQVAAMEFIKLVSDYPGLPRPAHVPDFPVHLSVSGGGIERRPPTLGEHTDQVLGALGYARARSRSSGPAGSSDERARSARQATPHPSDPAYAVTQPREMYDDLAAARIRAAYGDLVGRGADHGAAHITAAHLLFGPDLDDLARLETSAHHRLRSSLPKAWQRAPQQRPRRR
jgi:hypothetical protein